MSALSRRTLLTASAAAVLATAVPMSLTLAGPGDWIEVMGSASASGSNDRDAARRRALGDALLSAALAGGAIVQGHSVLSKTRMTSDLLVVRPMASVLAHHVVSEQFDGQLWRITIRAHVGPIPKSDCSARRRMILTMYPPRLRVRPSAPAWAEALAGDLSQRLAELVEDHPVVAEFTRANRLPNADPSRDRADYRVLTSGNVRVPAGGHGLHSDIEIEPSGRNLYLTLRLRLEGPGGEQIEKLHKASVRLPGVSLLGNAAPLVQSDRQAMAATLAQGVRPAMSDLLEEAGCRPVLARMQLSRQRLEVPVGRVHGVKRTNLAFTVDGDASTEMLEVVKLSERSAIVAPLDPARPLSAFDGRPIRFLDTVEQLW